MIVDVPGIPLRRRDGGLGYTLVDPADFVELNTWRWSTSSNGYAHRFDRDLQQPILMHRAIMGLTRGDQLLVDHINGERLDNRRSNLRVVTAAQNRQNITVARGTSRFRGVYFMSRLGKWCAHVKLDGIDHHLGYFQTEEEAGAVAAAWRSEHMPFSQESVA